MTAKKMGKGVKALFPQGQAPDPAMVEALTKGRSDIGWAMDVIRRGGKVKRAVWQDMFLCLTLSPATRFNLILAVKGEGQVAFWAPSHEELFAQDYVELVDVVEAQEGSVADHTKN